jgi:two-component system OmpR family sensor kinase/two-component system sensor histidine kinase BaeS
VNRLWVRFALAFALVVLVAVGAIAVLINRTTGAEFRRYVTHSGMPVAGSGMEALVEYYQLRGSWEGVGSLLSGGVYFGAVGVSEGPTGSRSPGFPEGPLNLLLADAKGKIVFDSTNGKLGKQLSRSDKAAAAAITQGSGGEVIGYLLLSVPDSRTGRGGLEQQFLDRVRTVLKLGGALAVGLSLIAGAILSRSLTAPLQRLAEAARAIAGGHVGHQVKVEGTAEVAEVGQAFNEMTSALKKAEIVRQNLVADVAHELRTPLTVLQGNLRAILDGVYAMDTAEISRLYDETRLLSRLVDDLRELALADAGQLDLNLQPTDIIEAIRNTVDTLALAAEAEQVVLTARLPEDIPAVQADPQRVAQVLRNLLINALRHTPPGGSVTAEVHLANGFVETAIVDTGEGIAPDDLSHVFERFWRADPARAHGDRFNASTGLGLSVAQSLVEAQGGRIWVESTVGKGATFRFTLPVLPKVL